jgi:hypothetical protein
MAVANAPLGELRGRKITGKVCLDEEKKFLHVKFNDSTIQDDLRKQLELSIGGKYHLKEDKTGKLIK